MADQVVIPTPPKKAGHRSPNYPAFALAIALEKVKLVYDNDRRAPTTLQVIAGHLGYKHTDGPGGRALSCLRQYGLLEESAGLFKVSETAYKLLYLPDEDKDKPLLMKQAALKTNLYRQLHEDYPSQIPSDATLKSNLLHRGFNPDSLDTLIADFRSTMDDAKVYNVSDYEDVDESIMQTPPEPAQPMSPTIPRATPHAAPSDAPVEKSYSLAFEGEGKAVLTLTGAYTTDDLDDLEAYIATTLKILRRSVKKESV